MKTPPPAPAVATLSLPVELLPSREEILEVYRQAAAAEVRRHFEWLTYKEAAAHMKCSKLTFERKKKALGIPVSMIDGFRVVARQDLDAILIQHTVAPDTVEKAVIQFPTQLAKQAAFRVA